MQRLLYSILFSLLFTGSIGSAQAQGTAVLSYGIPEGLARRDVTCLFQDKQGVLWVGTHGAGLYRFNAGRFHRTALKPGDTGYHIAQIGQDEEGLLYVLSEQGLFSFNGATILRVADPGVTEFLTTDEGLWWITGTLICRKAGTGGAKCEVLQAQHVIPDPLSKGVRILNGRSIEHVNTNLEASGLMMIRGDGALRYCGMDDAGALWYYAEEGKLVRYQGHLVAEFKVGEIDATTIVSGTSGSLLVGGETGVYTFQPFDTLRTRLPVEGRIQGLYYDDADRLWICTGDRGLLRYFGELYRSYTLPENHTITGMVAGRTTQSVIFTTAEGEVFSVDQSAALISPPDEVQGQIFAESTEQIWFLGSPGLFLHGDTSWVEVDSTFSYSAGDRIACQDPNGLWIKRSAGLERIRVEPVVFPTGIRLRRSVISGEIPQQEIVACISETAGTTILFSEREIGVIDGERYRKLHRTPYRILSVCRDKAGMYWIGTEAAGLYQWNGSDASPEPVQMSYPLRLLDVLFLGKTDAGLVAGTNRGALLLQFDTTGKRVTEVSEITEDAGLKLDERLPPLYALTEEGNLIIYQNHHLTELAPSASRAGGEAPEVSIEGIEIQGEDIYDSRFRNCMGPFYQQKRPVEVTTTESRLHIVMGTTRIDAGEQYFQWRTNTGQWSAPVTGPDLFFDGLEPGAYQIEVRACEAGGSCSEPMTVFNIQIRPVLWRRWWFIASVLIAIALLVWLVTSLRLRRKLAESESEKKRLEAELNALTAEQKAMQLQMHPHFIFNALQTVRSQIREDKLDIARENLTQFAKLMRAMLDTTRVERISLEDELAFLDAYVHVERMSRSLPIQYDVELSEEIEPFAMEIPPMLIQPVIENAIKYGGNGEMILVWLQMSWSEGWLHVTVSDNGKGFGSGQSAHQSASLDIIRNRLKKMGQGGNLSFEERLGGGTRVILLIPVA